MSKISTNTKNTNPAESSLDNTILSKHKQRWAMQVEYDGSAFHGWQQQKNAHSIQQHIEQAISKVAGYPIKTVCAGRTDKGVHASAQIIHFDCYYDRKVQSWIKGCNSWTNQAVSAINAWQVDDDFHARFSASSRSYCYVIYNHKVAPTYLRNNVSWYYIDLDESRMQEAAQYLIGKHDFTSFRASGCQASSAIRSVHYINIKRQGDFIYVEIKANAFLYHMVRNIMGLLLAIGNKKYESCFAKEILEAKDRSMSMATAIANGLYLTNVEYPNYPIINDQIKKARSIVPSFI